MRRRGVTLDRRGARSVAESREESAMTDEPTRMPPLTTERLLTREHLLEDVDALHEILDVDRGDDHPARTRAERERRTRWMIENYFQVASVYQMPHAEWSI